MAARLYFPLFFLMLAFPLRAETTAEVERFALIIGANKSIDEELKPLKYADDDAARYFDLMQTLGARTYLLARLDENTARLHPSAQDEAQIPGGDELAGVVALLKGNVRMARQRGARTEFYLFYAGHGNMKEGRGYITTENSRIYGPDVLSQIVDPISADQTHLIIDACYSFFLAYGRGAGGSHRKVEKLDGLQSLANRKNIGLLLSTSSAAESHEWESFQSGVFSHEIRSALYGAADADHDGLISYREIAAFVANANQAIPNEKYRPRLHARPPQNQASLIDINPAMMRHIEVAGSNNGHYLLENDSGVRLLDFHNASGQRMRLARTGESLLFLRNLTNNTEYAINPSEEPVQIASLTGTTPKVQDRGAAHHSFKKLFQEPFDQSVVESYAFETLAPESDGISLALVAGAGALGAGVLLTAAAVVSGSIGAATYATAAASEDQTSIMMRNNVIMASYGVGAVLVVGGGLVGAMGVGALLWPTGDDDSSAGASFE